jgi:hypothetical protein
MMNDKNWFQKKWGTPKVPIDILLDRVEQLEDRLMKLEEENIETSNVLYEIINSTEAIDRRIDIIFEELTK